MRTPPEIRSLIESELVTDRAYDDVTTRLLGATFPACEALIRAREPGVFCGEAVVSAFRQIFSNEAEIYSLASDGRILEPGDSVVQVKTTVGLCLTLERTLINFLGHLSGVATMTKRFVDQVAGYPTKILATRKTLPGLRELQLMAVRAGGGHIHRRNLSDGILIKDNHLAFLVEQDVLERARRNRSPLHRIEIEIQSMSSLEKVLQNPPDVIMLDNFGIDDLRKAVAMIGDRAEIEVSGGMTVETVGQVAALGVHYISVGAITHSAPSLNLSLDILPNRI